MPQEDAGTPVIRVLHYTADHNEAHTVHDLRELKKYADQPGVTWIAVDGLGDEQAIVHIGALFGLHPLALEDVANVHQRAKVELYADYLFVIGRAYASGTSPDTKQVAMFLKSNVVITFQESGVDCLDAVRRRIVSNHGQLGTSGADYLLYALLDATIDSYFPALEAYGERLDALDERISAGGDQHLIDQIHHIRSELLTIRRSVWPLREAISTLIRDSGTLISDETDLYLRDCYDHTIQIIDVIETDRELCADLRDFYLTVVSNRMNQVMKFLTIIATLFIPLSFIAGLYGMNFNTEASPWNMPELNWALGYPFALTLMASLAGGMLYFFWRKSWL